MGLFDDISARFNRGADAAGRTARSLKLKGQIAEVNKRRQSLAAQLGAIMYERLKEDEAARGGCEELFDGIAACDEERARCQAAIEAIEAEAAAANAAAKTLECPRCRTRVSAGDLFCSGCGMPVEEIKAAVAARAEEEAAGAAMCSRCGAPVSDDDVFCTVCGARLDDVPAAEIVQVESVGEEAAQADADMPSQEDAVDATGAQAAAEMRSASAEQKGPEAASSSERA